MGGWVRERERKREKERERNCPYLSPLQGSVCVWNGWMGGVNIHGKYDKLETLQTPLGNGGHPLILFVFWGDTPPSEGSGPSVGLFWVKKGGGDWVSRGSAGCINRRRWGGRDGQRGFHQRGLVGGNGSVVTQQSYRHD